MLILVHLLLRKNYLSGFIKLLSIFTQFGHLDVKFCNETKEYLVTSLMHNSLLKIGLDKSPPIVMFYEFAQIKI